MGMGFGLAVRTDVPMHIQIRDHPAIDKFGLHEIAGKLDAIDLAHLARNGKFDLASKLRVLALLASRSEEHTSELQSLMRISYAVFCLKKKKNQITQTKHPTSH